jgi:hypothetical protein
VWSELVIADRVILRRINVEKVIDIAGGILSDYNGVQCVQTKSGYRLLIWSDCGGSACGHGFSFFIIDPHKLSFIAPRKSGQICNAKCASTILGSDLPHALDKEEGR